MSEILNTVTPSRTFSPVETVEPMSSLENELHGKLSTQGVNLGLLIVTTFNVVEAHANNKAHLKIDELEAHEKKLKLVTKLLSAIETQLANPDIKEVRLEDLHGDIEEMRKISDHKLFDKTKWSRDEAIAVKTALTRDSQMYMQEIHHTSNEVNRKIEEGTELLQIARKCLEMLDRLHQSFTSNQRSR